MVDVGGGSSSTGRQGDGQGRLSAMGSNGIVMGTEYHIFLDRRQGDCPPVGGVACSTAFLTLEEGLDLYDNKVARKAGESPFNRENP